MQRGSQVGRLKIYLGLAAAANVQLKLQITAKFSRVWTMRNTRNASKARREKRDTFFAIETSARLPNSLRVENIRMWRSIGKPTGSDHHFSNVQSLVTNIVDFAPSWPPDVIPPLTYTLVELYMHNLLTVRSSLLSPFDSQSHFRPRGPDSS